MSHATIRLQERYEGVDFRKLSNWVLKSRQFELLDEDELGAICKTKYEDKEVYFVMHNRYRGEEIATFLTKKMAEDALGEKQARREDV